MERQQGNVSTANCIRASLPPLYMHWTLVQHGSSVDHFNEDEGMTMMMMVKKPLGENQIARRPQALPWLEVHRVRNLPRPV